MSLRCCRNRWSRRRADRWFQHPGSGGRLWLSARTPLELLCRCCTCGAKPWLRIIRRTSSFVKVIWRIRGIWHCLASARSFLLTTLWAGGFCRLRWPIRWMSETSWWPPGCIIATMPNNLTRSTLALWQQIKHEKQRRWKSHQQQVQMSLARRRTWPAILIVSWK